MVIDSVEVGALNNNTYLVVSKNNNAVLIDPGMDFDKIDEMLKKSGAKLKYIFLTHGHYDHTATVFDFKEKYGAKVVIGTGDEEMLSDSKKSLAWMFTREPKIVTADITVNDGDKIELDEIQFKFISTPGHSKGSFVILCGDVLFTGDTVLCGTVGRMDFYGGSEEEMLKSVKKIASFDKNYRLLCGHGKESTLDEEKARNLYFIAYA